MKDSTDEDSKGDPRTQEMSIDYHSSLKRSDRRC